MGKSGAILEKRGVSPSIGAGMRIRVNPGLADRDGNSLDVHKALCDSGCVIASIQGNSFDIQNMTGDAQTPSWVATWTHSTQQDKTIPSQTDVGPSPGVNPSPDDPLNLASGGAQFMEVDADLFADYRFQDLTDSGPNGYDLSKRAGTEKRVVSPLGISQSLVFDGATDYMLSNIAHNPAFQAWAKLDSSVLYFAGFQDRPTGNENVIFISGDTASALAVENILWRMATLGATPGLYIGGEPGPSDIFSMNLQSDSAFAVAFSKEPGATGGKVVQKIHSPFGVLEALPESTNSSDGDNAELFIGGGYDPTAGKWTGSAQQVLFQSSKPSDADIAKTLKMIMP